MVQDRKGIQLFHKADLNLEHALCHTLRVYGCHQAEHQIPDTEIKT